MLKLLKDLKKIDANSSCLTPSRPVLLLTGRGET
jgi:hypothetical protein